MTLTDLSAAIKVRADQLIALSGQLDLLSSSITGMPVMALQDDINTALSNLDAAIQAVADDITKFAADLAAALANNNTAAAQTALDGINSRVATLQGIVTANPAP
jgi:hypothetical protein